MPWTYRFAAGFMGLCGFFPLILEIGRFDVIPYLTVTGRSFFEMGYPVITLVLGVTAFAIFMSYIALTGRSPFPQDREGHGERAI